MTLIFAIAMGALALAPLLASRLGRPAAFCSALGCVLLVLVGITAATGGAHPVLYLGGWLGFGPTELRADGLAGIFLALTGLVGAATAIAYVERPCGRWLTGLGATLVLFVAIAIGADNAFLFFLAWEALTVCIYLLASADCSRPGAQVAGYLTAGLTKLGGAALLAAFGLLYAHTHSFALNVWLHAPLGVATKGVLFGLFTASFATKVGVMPLQGALPAGYGAAPRLGAASLSVALCAGYYGLWRFVFSILGPLPVWCGDALLILGAVTALTGIVYAITQDELRGFLGYSTVEHSGIVVLGLGVALLGQSAHNPRLAAAGLLAATLHVCAHNLAKTLALISVDRVEQATGQRALDPLGGLGPRLPASAGALGVASLTLAAIPPLGGFVSEWFTFQALLQGFRMPTLLAQLLCALGAAALALTSGVGLLAFAKFYGFIFLGRARQALPGLIEPRGVPLSIGLLGLVVVLLGTVAPWEIHALGSGLASLLGLNPASTAITHPLTLGPVFPMFSVLAPTWLTIVLPGYALIAILIARTTGHERGVRRAPVWVTGSGADLERVQYRPSSFSNPLRVVLSGPLGFRTWLQRVDEHGGAMLVRHTSVVLAVDRFLYQPLTDLSVRVSTYVRASQSGRLSTYLLYMAITLISALPLIPILR